RPELGQRVDRDVAPLAEQVDRLGDVLARVAQGGHLVIHDLAEGVGLLHVGGPGEDLGRGGGRRGGGGGRGRLRGGGRGGRCRRRGDRAGGGLVPGAATGGEGEGPGKGGEEDTARHEWLLIGRWLGSGIGCTATGLE